MIDTSLKEAQGYLARKSFQTGFVVAGFLSYWNHQLIKFEEGIRDSDIKNNFVIMKILC